jgi:hypothetical protein
LLALLVKPIRALLNLPEKQYYLVDANPELIRLVLEPEDFSIEFGWFLHWVAGSEYGATSILDGYYSHQRLSIIQSVYLYGEPQVWDKPGGIQFLGKSGVLGSVRNLEDENLVDFQKAECLFNLDDTIICRVNIGNSDIGYELEINYGKQGDIAGIERILNVIFDAMDDKLNSK